MWKQPNKETHKHKGKVNFEQKTKKSHIIATDNHVQISYFGTEPSITFVCAFLYSQNQTAWNIVATKRKYIKEMTLNHIQKHTNSILTIRAESCTTGPRKRNAGILEAAKRVHGQKRRCLHNGGLGTRKWHFRLWGPSIILKQNSCTFDDTN